MKKFIFVFLILIFIVSACTSTKTEVEVIPTITVPPTVSYTSPSNTTPLPTIPTFTPTFDVSKIVTVTPAEKAECPKENSSVVANFATPNINGLYQLQTAADILDYLNQGGVLAPLRDTGFGEIVDLTRDGLSEVVYKGLVRYNIFGCIDRKYQDLFYFPGSYDVNLADIGDFNENGILEIVLYDVTRYGFYYVHIYEWDGNKFRSLINAGIDTSTGIVINEVYTTVPHKVIDTNMDGIQDIVILYDNNQLCGGVGGFCDGTPTRKITTTLEWNGQNYVVKRENYAPAQYRFQSIQDGDREVLYGNYETALKHYQDVIYDSSLEWWTKERKEFEVKLFYDSYNPITPTPWPYPLVDLSEYPRLASYAYYRIMLIQLVQDQDTEAPQTYQTLQDTFGNNMYAKPYIEIATEFLEAYRVNQSMYDGCAVVIQYAVEHPEILIPLGSDYHGSQSKIYEPEDICPFR